MQCYVCQKRPGTVHLTQIVGDEAQHIDLCHRCAKAKGIDRKSSFALHDLVMGLGVAEPTAKSEPIYVGRIDLSLLMNPLMNRKWLPKYYAMLRL